MINSSKSKSISVGPCLRCNEDGHIARDCPTKTEKKPKPFFNNISVSWDDHYEFGDDDDVDFKEQANLASFMARLAVDSESESEDHSKAN